MHALGPKASSNGIDRTPHGILKETDRFT